MSIFKPWSREFEYWLDRYWLIWRILLLIFRCDSIIVVLAFSRHLCLEIHLKYLLLKWYHVWDLLQNNLVMQRQYWVNFYKVKMVTFGYSILFERPFKLNKLWIYKKKKKKLNRNSSISISSLCPHIHNLPQLTSHTRMVHLLHPLNIQAHTIIPP